VEDALTTLDPSKVPPVFNQADRRHRASTRGTTGAAILPAGCVRAGSSGVWSRSSVGSLRRGPDSIGAARDRSQGGRR
jgi:hypothetical protein